MDAHLLGAVFSGLALLGSALNAWQNRNIQIAILESRKELVEEKIQPLAGRLIKLETQIEPLVQQCPLLHAASVKPAA